MDVEQRFCCLLSISEEESPRHLLPLLGLLHLGSFTPQQVASKTVLLPASLLRRTDWKHPVLSILETQLLEPSAQLSGEQAWKICVLIQALWGRCAYKGDSFRQAILENNCEKAGVANSGFQSVKGCVGSFKMHANSQVFVGWRQKGKWGYIFISGLASN